MNKIIFIVFLLITSSIVFGQKSDKIEIGIDENLGGFLPLQAEFVTSENDTVKLAELINKPTLLALVYYECPGICSPMLTDLAWVAGKIQLEPGEDYQIITVSIDPDETPVIARNWKRNFFSGMKKALPYESWKFLTGDTANIKLIADSIGYYYQKHEEFYTHPGALIAISPKGKISRYIFGLTYNPFDLKMALLDAGSGKTNPTVAKVLQFCFSYDPEGRGYSLNVTRISGTIILAFLGLFLGILIIRKKKKSTIDKKEKL